MMKNEGRLKILFLEDIPTDVEIAVRELRKHSIEFTHMVAEDRLSFEEQLRTFKPDMVISDFMLPTINGLEALRISLETDPAVPVLILTGSMNEETAVACMKAGASDYVVKDFIVKLPFAVKEALHKRKAVSDLQQKTFELNTYFDNALDLFCIANSEGYFLRLNRSWEQTLGYSLSDLEGAKFLDFIHPDDLQKTLDVIGRLKNDEEILNFVNRYRCKDGGYRFIEWRSRTEGDLIYAAARDITERVDTELKLKTDKDRYRLLFEGNPLPMWVYELETLRFVAVNNAAVIKYGYSQEEFASMTIKDIRPVEDIQMLIDNVQSSTGDYEKTSAWRHLLKDGTVINVEIVSHGLEFDGKQCRMVMANDITQRVADEQEIIKLNRIYSVLSNVNKSIVRINERQKLLDEICRVGTLFGKFKLVWFGELDEEEQNLRVLNSSGVLTEKLVSLSRPFRELLRSGSPCSEAISLAKPVIVNNIDETYKTSAIHEDILKIGAKSLACLPVKLPGEKRGVICFYAPEKNFFDETEVNLLSELSTDIAFALEAIVNDQQRREIMVKLKKSEERYRKFFEEDLTADYISSVTGELIDCNKAYVKMFGFRDRDHAIATRAMDLYERPEQREEYIGIVKERGGVERHEITYRSLQGQKIHTILNSFGHFDSEGNLQRIQGYIFDITDIKKAAVEMKAARELAERSNMLKDAFIANISHEIRTPMNAIIGFTGIIRESLVDKVDKELAEYFNVIDEAGARLMRTVDLILSLSKLQAGIMETKMSEIDPETEIGKIITHHRPSSERKGLPVRLINNTGIRKLVTDEYCFTEVISNFIDNAIKYTEKGEIRIVMELRKSGDLAINVIDTGIGIEKQFQDRLFQPFVQEESGYSRSYDGVGLGLSIVKRFADLSGYGIEFESEKGKGSRFSLILPEKLFKESSEKGESGGIKEKIETGEMKKNFGLARKEAITQIRTRAEEGKPLVYAVEDDEDSQVYISTVLSGKYNIELASTDKELFTMLETQLPEIILMDISLRGSRDGLEITRELKADKRYSEIPVIAVTAHAFQSDRINAMEAGCAGFLSKPYSPGELFKLISAALKES
jgi:PAS domain S-box-containing protein